MHNPLEPRRRADRTLGCMWGHLPCTACELGGGWGVQHIPIPCRVCQSLVFSLRGHRQPPPPCFDPNSHLKFKHLLATNAQGTHR